MTFSCRQLWAGTIILAVISFLSVQPLAAQANSGHILNTARADSQAWIDWEKGKLHVVLSAPIDQGDVRNRSSLLSRKEAEIKLLFPSLFPYFLNPVRIDSARTYDDLIRSDAGFAASLAMVREQAMLIRSQPSRDLKSVSLEYIFPLMPQLTAPLIDFQQPMELDRILEWHPKAEYTGIVIHAEGELPWYGNDGNASLKPALFPRILDEDGRIVLSAGHLIPQAARRWGTVAYASGTRPELQSERAGDRPFITMARSVFGSSPTDVVISRDDATMLLYNDSTRRALAEGRIILAVSPVTLHEESGR